MKIVDLVFLYFLSQFLFSIFLFLEPRVRVSHVTQKKRVEDARRMMSYYVYNACWS